jgi:hypothetical protein
MSDVRTAQGKLVRHLRDSASLAIPDPQERGNALRCGVLAARYHPFHLVDGFI